MREREVRGKDERERRESKRDERDESVWMSKKEGERVIERDRKTYQKDERDAPTEQAGTIYEATVKGREKESSLT